MSFEMTLVCDGCSRVLDGGDELEMQTSLVEGGGRALVRETGGWRDSGQPSAIPASRHLCEACANVDKLFNGERVYESVPAEEKGNDA